MASLGVCSIRSYHNGVRVNGHGVRVESLFGLGVVLVDYGFGGQVCLFAALDIGEVVSMFLLL